MNSLIFKRVGLLARRVPAPLRPLLYAIGGIFWLLGPPLIFVLLMVIAGMGAWGVGWVVYDLKGRPQNFEVRHQRSMAAQVVNVLQPQMTNRLYFLGLQVDLPEDRFRNTLEQRYRWETVGPGGMKLNEKVGLVYGLDGQGVVTRAVVMVEGIDEQQIIGLLARTMAMWGEPHAKSTPIGETNRAFEAICWQDNRSLVSFDFSPMPGGQGSYRLMLRVYSELDPMFRVRADTFGFPPVYRHLEALREDKRDRETRAAERAEDPAAPITGMRPGAPGRPGIIR